MAATLTGMSLFTTGAVPKAEMPRQVSISSWRSWTGYKARRMSRGRVASSGPTTPPGISEKVSESIKHAEEACSDDPVSGECVAAWDEVEELSAAASHARDKLKESSDPLESYCKDNPETDECRTYDN
ncbi:hypothetical protein J5N97_015383 [Dioscorea zingiberensis]|uniref:CP12 domain-containing protein n=1 Tax=Dioscorea zingiberensis TaxID=325984 RepID=A0A9D5HKJ5_9LILI|nr:hypothetical protein J5N97_015383 [Dioscorea zingiberensis]